MKDLTLHQVVQKCSAELPGYSSAEQTLCTLNVKYDHKHGSGKRIYNEVYGWSRLHDTYREAFAEMVERMKAQEAREVTEKAGSVQ